MTTNVTTPLTDDDLSEAISNLESLAIHPFEAFAEEVNSGLADVDARLAEVAHQIGNGLKSLADQGISLMPKQMLQAKKYIQTMEHIKCWRATLDGDEEGSPPSLATSVVQTEVPPDRNYGPQKPTAPPPVAVKSSAKRASRIQPTISDDQDDLAIQAEPRESRIKGKILWGAPLLVGVVLVVLFPLFLL